MREPRRRRGGGLGAAELAGAAALGLACAALASPRGAAAQDDGGGGIFAGILEGTLRDLGSRFGEKEAEEEARPSYRELMNRLGASQEQEQDLTSAAMSSLVAQGKPVSQGSLMSEVSSLIDEIEAEFASGGGGWEVARPRRGRQGGGAQEEEQEQTEEQEEEPGEAMFGDSDRTGAAFMDDLILDAMAAREARSSEVTGERVGRTAGGR